MDEYSAEVDEQQADMRRAIGYHGEELAADYLVEQGWEIVAQNYQTDIGELDLVVKRSERLHERVEHTLAFVEVKTRRSATGPPPEASVDRRKRARLVRLARVYVMLEKVSGIYIRFDVVSVDLSGEEPVITHFPAAFDAEGTIC